MEDKYMRKEEDESCITEVIDEEDLNMILEDANVHEDIEDLMEEDTCTELMQDNDEKVPWSMRREEDVKGAKEDVRENEDYEDVKGNIAQKLSLVPISVASCTDHFEDVGELVWGKLKGDKWWAGIKIPGTLAGMNRAPRGMVWVFWFGDHKISKIHEENIEDFISYYPVYCERKGGKHFVKGLLEALMICEQRCDIDTERDLGLELFQWANKDFPLPSSKGHTQIFDLVKPSTAFPLPEFVGRHLEELAKYQKYDNSEFQKKKRRGDVCSGIEMVCSGVKKIEEICLSCDDADEEVVCHHPLFDGGLCSDCKELMMTAWFDIEEDGASKFCCICSEGGDLFVCDNKACCRYLTSTHCDVIKFYGNKREIQGNSVTYMTFSKEINGVTMLLHQIPAQIELFVYRTACLKSHDAYESSFQIEQSNPWKCFLCQPFCAKTHGPLHPKVDWRGNFYGLFGNQTIDIEVPNYSYLRKIAARRPRLQVLSLFDGIATGKLALDMLGLDVQAYYSCEIEEDCKAISGCYHGNSIIHLGDVRDLTVDKILSLGHIDLLTGATPWQELTYRGHDIHKLDRKNTENHCLLFFEFYRVLSVLLLNAKITEHHTFWMFETNANILPEARLLISRFLRCQPAVWNANHFCPINKNSLIWGNLPAIYKSPQSCNEPTMTLKDILTPNLSRVAMYDTLSSFPEVDPVADSVEVDKNSAPVLMNGKADFLWPSELERILGFPVHYTDSIQLCIGRRYQILKEAWCVYVIKAVLCSLLDHFKMKVP